MSTRKKIIYWITTLWLALGMISTAVVQLIPLQEEVKAIEKLGYPPYLMTLIGIWKILGVIAILIPGYALLKEWAYAGFFFAMSGAAVSHMVSGDSIGEQVPPLLLLVLTIFSWSLRPPGRKITQNSTNHLYI